MPRQSQAVYLIQFDSVSRVLHLVKQKELLVALRLRYRGRKEKSSDSKSRLAGARRSYVHAGNVAKPV